MELIKRLSPNSHSMMEFKGTTDIAVAEKLFTFEMLGQEISTVWNISLSTEFHMTNDSYLFKTSPAKNRFPLYEGRMMHQFTHTWNDHPARYWIDESEAQVALKGTNRPYQSKKHDYETYRIAFRGIARNTDLRSMIATILPPQTFCSDMLQNCVVYDEKIHDAYAHHAQLYLLACWNSFTFDFLLRQRITSRVSFHFLYQLPVPRLVASDPRFSPIVQRAAHLICTTPEFDDLAKAVGLKPLAGAGSNPHPNPLPGGEGTMHKYGTTDPTERAKLRAELDGLVAHLYGLTEAEFAHILGTFPLVPEPTKIAALNAWRDVETGLIQ